ncbi:hypothetical protein LCGC14_1317250 [marine sediment metagenome]|uniref:Uncharacterized protein n=1 Tax=marine sediment metagenome TaxID=412755 RepID=A0A0F9KKJ9_9ZZZZ
MALLEGAHEAAVSAFNEWMRQYTEEPEKFRHTVREVQEFLEAQNSGREPTYGERCVATLERMATIVVEVGG